MTDMPDPGELQVDSARRILPAVRPQLVRVVLVDGDQEFSTRLQSFLAASPEVALVGCFDNARDAQLAFRSVELAADVALIDYSLPGARALLQTLVRFRPDVERLAIGDFLNELNVFSAIEAGANGMLLKSLPFSDWVLAIVAAVIGDTPMSPPVLRRVFDCFRDLRRAARDDEVSALPAQLTRREEQVIQLLARGFSYQMIAGELGITVGTLQGYIKVMYKKLGISNKAEAAAVAFRRGLIR